MDNSLITPYTKALSAQKAQLEGYLNQGFQTITVPANISQIETSKLHMLGKSAIWFAVIGVIALVAGIVLHQMGIIVTGAAALLSGAYLWMKGKQASRAEAFQGLGTKIYGEISVIADKIAGEWKSFVTVQNDNLKKQIVGSADSTDSKVAMIDKIESTPEVKLNLDAVRSDLQTLGAKENLDDFKSYIAKTQNTLKTAIDNVDGAQQTIYSTIASAK